MAANDLVNYFCNCFSLATHLLFMGFMIIKILVGKPTSDGLPCFDAPMKAAPSQLVHNGQAMSAWLMKVRVFQLVGHNMHVAGTVGI